MRKLYTILVLALLVIPLALPAFAGGAEGAPSGTFIDDDDSEYEEYIEYAAKVGITKGCNPPVNDMYCPDDAVTRGQMAAFMVRAFGLNLLNVQDATPIPPCYVGFIDADCNDTVFVNDIAIIKNHGITKGCNPPVNDMYCPDQMVTRAQMATFIVRAKDIPPVTVDSFDPFVDDNGSVHEGDIESLAALGIPLNCNEMMIEFCPGEPLTRAEMAFWLWYVLEGGFPNERILTQDAYIAHLREHWRGQFAELDIALAA